MGWGMAIANIAGSLIGDEISASSQRSTNAQSLANQKQMEDWEEKMSDTAMTRRVADLKNANLNPMLAIGEGGASTPGIGPVSLGNPGASYGQLGSQMSNAVQASTAASQQHLNEAQATTAASQAHALDVKAAMDLGINTDMGRQSIADSQARVVYMQLQGDALQWQNRLTSAQIAQTDEMTTKIGAEIANLGASKSLTEAQTALTNLNSAMQGMTNGQFKIMAPELFVQAHAASQKAGFDLATIEQAAKVSSVPYLGPTMAFMDRVFNWFHVGANISSVSKQ